MDENSIRDHARAVIELVTIYYATLADRRIMPDTTSEKIRALLHEPLPREATEFADVLRIVSDIVLPLSRHNGHPRFFGYIASGSQPVAALGHLLAAALNSNVTAWRSAPAPAELEHLTINWLKQMIGYPTDATGILVSGGSMANFAALACAAAVRRGRVYISDQAHSSILRAARLLGLEVGIVSGVRFDAAAVEQQILSDLNAGLRPSCVVATAGTTNTGAVDPLDDIARVARRYGLWFHVDGAYGAFAALAPSTCHLFRGIEHADSVTLDPHKWLSSGMGCGCILYRDAETARRTFASDADYTRVIGHENDEAFAFWDFGPELSRPFRALPLWMLIKHAGRDAISASIERNLQCARYFERLINESRDFEMLAPVELSVFCFRHNPPGFEGDLDELNERVLLNLQRLGSSYLSNTRIDGQFALRGCVLNASTTESDMDRLLDDLRTAAARSHRLTPA